MFGDCINRCWRATYDAEVGIFRGQPDGVEDGSQFARVRVEEGGGEAERCVLGVIGCEPDAATGDSFFRSQAGGGFCDVGADWGRWWVGAREAPRRASGHDFWRGEDVETVR